MNLTAVVSGDRRSPWDPCGPWTQRSGCVSRCPPFLFSHLFRSFVRSFLLSSATINLQLLRRWSTVWWLVPRCAIVLLRGARVARGLSSVFSVLYYIRVYMYVCMYVRSVPYSTHDSHDATFLLTLTFLSFFFFTILFNLSICFEFLFFHSCL